MSTVNIYELAQTWNNGSTAFNAISMNVTDTASNIESNLIRLQEGGNTRFRVRKDGSIFNTGSIETTGPLVINRGTLTTNDLAWDITTTWSNAAVTFTGLRYNVTDTASNANSLLMNLLVGGTSVFRVRKDGSITTGMGSLAVPAIGITDNGSHGFFALNNGILAFGGPSRSEQFRFRPNGEFVLRQGGFFGVTGGSSSDTPDTLLLRDATDTWGQRRGTNPQAWHLYNTFTNTNNWERLRIAWESNVCVIAPQRSGTGAVRVLHISGLPTSNPGPGILWNDAGTVKVGT